MLRISVGDEVSHNLLQDMQVDSSWYMDRLCELCVVVV